jgi:hypothetical protein
MRTMGRGLLLLLVVAFMAGVWDARSERGTTPRRAAAPFGTGPVARERTPRMAPQLVSVRVDERDGYDRVVFTFDGSMPGYRVRYLPRVDGPGGRPLPLPGAAFVEVAFEPARVRGPDGRTTFPAGAITPSSPVLRQVRFAGDFEGQVRFGLGLAGRGGVRVSELADPTRVAVDVR